MHMLKLGCVYNVYIYVYVLSLHVDNKSYYATNGVVQILL